jgi:hypothetical protein
VSGVYLKYMPKNIILPTKWKSKPPLTTINNYNIIKLKAFHSSCCEVPSCVKWTLPLNVN